MRNLALITCINASLPPLDGVGVKMAIDEDTGAIYVNTSAEIVCTNVNSSQEIFSMSYTDIGRADIKVADLQFMQGEGNLCLAAEHGDLLLINIETKMVECVGTVDSGLRSMKWSPDQELVLLATGHGTVIAMTRDFDPVAEVNIHAKEFGKGEFVNVGWGKKETQFHGSVGKAAAKQKVESVEPALPWDDGNVQVVWRGDGEYFAVSMVDPEDGNRKFRVWNRECILQYTSEYVSGLESALAWRPSGNLLASSQRKPHRHDVIFFEKNGLQHGEFTLPFEKDEVMVKQLDWNADSSILAVWLTDLVQDSIDTETQNIKHYLQLWTMSNYHWYLKQSHHFQKEDSLCCVQWDSEHSYRLHVVSRSGRYRQYNYGKFVNDSTYPVRSSDCDSEISSVKEEKNQSFVAVIDGNNVLMTPFQVMVVPPPMCAYKLILPEAVNSVCFLPSKSCPNDVAVCLKGGQVAIFTTNLGESKGGTDLEKLVTKLDAAGGNGFISRLNPHSPKALLKVVADNGTMGEDLHHWLWLSQTQMFAVYPGSVPGTDNLVLFDLDCEKEEMFVCKSATVDGSVLSTSHCTKEFILLQMQNGKICRCSIPELTTSDYLMPSGSALTLPRPCSHVSVCTFSGKECVVGLSEHFRLYLNETEVASDCSSFCVHDDFLFLTTHAHTLRCISRNATLEDVLKYFTTPLEGRALLQSISVSESHRAVERGSRIVTVTPSDCRLLLQMPRGNLEEIHPRCLVLSLAKRYISSLNFKDAFTVMKKHRISMNLFYDLDRKLFEENVHKFVCDLGSSSDINIFIGDLRNEDLVQTMYKQYFLAGSDTNTASEISPSSLNKVNTVCDLLIEEFEKDINRFIMPLVTAHVKKSPSEVGKALTVIRKLSDENNDASNEKLVDKVLKYMTVLVESNTLFNEALGTYDFKLVLMVAEKSQQDPKEFMPILQDLQKLEENYRKYKIDVKLRRYVSALQHIAKCDDHFEECTELVTHHEMYREALNIFEKGSERHTRISRLYGDYLRGKHRNGEAGIIFSRCGDLQPALECFAQSSNTSLALSTAFKLKLKEEKMAELAYKLADRAKASGRHSEAVDILERYAHDVELAVEAGLHAHLWQKVMCLIEQYNRHDLKETHLHPSIIEAFEQTCTSLESHKLLISNHSARLKVVRQNRERLKMQSLIEGVDGPGMDSDLYSDAGSTVAGSVSSVTTSNVSRTTGRTNRSRKKRERQRYSLKEGSRHEDLALLHSLKTTIKTVDELSDDVRSLCLHLSLLDHDEQGRRLQELYSQVRHSISDILPSVWSADALQSSTHATGPQSTVNSILASVQAGRPDGDSGHMEKQNYEDMELFLPPKFSNKTSWKMDYYTTT